MIPEDSRAFPEVLMDALVDTANSDIITFLPDGKFFAVRVNEFSDDLLRRHFGLSSFDEFLDRLLSWGFNAISSNQEEQEEGSGGKTGDCQEATPEGSIQVFCHPQFRQGGSLDPRHVPLSRNCLRSSAGSVGNPPPMPRPLEQPISERVTSHDASVYTSKRRLSPSHASKDRETEDIKQRAFENEEVSVAYRVTSSYRPARWRSSLEVRSKVLAVTTAQLSLNDGQPSVSRASIAQRRALVSLVDGGVDNATHNIVTDAIETLLFDESHTRATYLKHEKELSTSSLPGVVPISKQLFSPSTSDGPSSVKGVLSRIEDNIVAAEQALYHGGEGSFLLGDISNQIPSTASPPQLEATVALVKQAGANDEVRTGPSLKDCEVIAEASSETT
jgi:hypothetical protein